MAKMKEPSRKVLAYLQAAGVGVKFTHAQVQKDLDFEKVNGVVGVVTGLCKRGLAVREPAVITDENGKEKKVSVFYLTEKGAAFDPDAEEEA
jgi:hypothetical protein